MGLKLTRLPGLAHFAFFQRRLSKIPTLADVELRR
jgi:hypothetical protein